MYNQVYEYNIFSKARYMIGVSPGYRERKTGDVHRDSICVVSYVCWRFTVVEISAHFIQVRVVLYVIL